MINKQITIKQHYVPGVYLKRFGDDKGLLNVLDLANKRIGNKKHYNQVCFDKYFYASNTGVKDDVSQSVEEYLKSVEDNLGGFLDEFEYKVLENKHISEEGLWQMAYVISFMWIRSLAFRTQMNKMSGDMMKKSMQLTVDSFVHMTDDIPGCQTLEEEKKIKEFIIKGDYDIIFNNVSQLKFFAEVEEFAKKFVVKRWLIHISECDYNFITSDNPIIETFPHAKGFYGRDIWSRHQFFAISPKILIELQPNYNVSYLGKRVKRKRLYDKVDVFKLNLLRADSSHNYCYGQSKKEFDALVLLREHLITSELRKVLRKQS